jgi:EmrB/QacA subfamily drug resistance transporter
MSSGTTIAERVDRRLVQLAAVIVIGGLAAMLDLTMVSVALNRLASDLHTSFATIQWVSTGYLLAITTVIPVTGWAADRFGAKSVWMFALGLFMTASALCGAAWSAGSLIAFRVLQGFGGGMIVPLSIAILAQAAGPARRGRVMSMVALPAQVAPIAGPLIGGLIVDAASWRWIFYVNVPVCLLALVLAWRVIPGTRADSRGGGLDVLGLALLSPGVAAVVYGLYRLSTGHSFVLPLVAGLALLGGYAWHALSTRVVPLVDLRLFRHRPFAAASALNFLSRASIFGALILLPLYYQQVAGRSALTAGLLLAPQALGTSLGLLVVGKLTDRIGARPIVLCGLLIGALGTVAYTQVTADTSEVLLATSLLVWGLGIAAATVPVMAAAYHGMPATDIPRATSAITTVQTVGASCGAAALVLVLQHELGRHAADPARAYGATFWWTLGFTVLAFVPALLLPKGDPTPARSS